MGHEHATKRSRCFVPALMSRRPTCSAPPASLPSGCDSVVSAMRSNLTAFRGGGTAQLRRDATPRPLGSPIVLRARSACADRPIISDVHHARVSSPKRRADRGYRRRSVRLRTSGETHARVCLMSDDDASAVNRSSEVAAVTRGRFEASWNPEPTPGQSRRTSWSSTPTSAIRHRHQLTLVVESVDATSVGVDPLPTLPSTSRACSRGITFSENSRRLSSATSNGIPP